jgi:hypothetical protein
MRYRAPRHEPARPNPSRERAARDALIAEIWAEWADSHAPAERLEALAVHLALRDKRVPFLSEDERSKALARAGDLARELADRKLIDAALARELAARFGGRPRP